MTQDRTRFKEYKAKMDAYQEQNDIEVYCERESHHEQPVYLGSFTRVSGRLVSTSNPPNAPVLNDDFELVGMALADDGETMRRHDTGAYSTSLTHNGDTPLTEHERNRRPRREKYKLKCPECPNELPVRDDKLQPVLKQLEGKMKTISLHGLRSLVK